MNRPAPWKRPFLIFALVLSLAAPIRPAQAVHRDVRAVLITGGYGLLGGAALGLLTLPFNQNPRTIALGASLGLYLGLTLGMLFVYDRRKQESRLGSLGSVETRDEDLRRLAATVALPQKPTGTEKLVRFDVPVVSF